MPRYNPNQISPLVSQEERRRLMARGVYRPSGQTINPQTGQQEWTAGGWRNPARLAFQTPESAGNVGPYYRERLEEMEMAGGRVPRPVMTTPATLISVPGQSMAESPAVQQWRESQRIRDAQARMAGQLQGGAYNVGTMDTRQWGEQQVASLAAPGGALTLPRTGTPEGTMANLSPVSPSLADTSFFPDQEIYTNPGAVDAGTLGAYQRRVNNFRRDFLQKAAQRKSNFSSVEEFKSFVENNPNYSPEIGTAAWDFAQVQLQRANPGLFQRITAQDKTREANNLSKVQWMDETMPNIASGMTSEQKIQYMNANPELTQQWKDNAPRYRMNPANQLELIPPSPEKAYEIERRKTGQYFTEEEKMDMAAQGVPIIQTPAGLLAPGDRAYDHYVAKVPVKGIDPETGDTVTMGYNRVPFGGVQLYDPRDPQGQLPANVRTTISTLKQKLQQPGLKPVDVQLLQAEIDRHYQVAPSAVMSQPVQPTTIQGGRGTITGAGGQVMASRGIAKSVTPSPVVQPKAVTTPPVKTTALGQPKERQRQELLASAPSFDDDAVFNFVGEKAKSAGMTVSDWANKGAELVGKAPFKTIETAKHLKTYIPNRIRIAIEDEMREQWVEKQLAKKAGK